jgi:hypothetical protein
VSDGAWSSMKAGRSSSRRDGLQWCASVSSLYKGSLQRAVGPAGPRERSGAVERGRLGLGRRGCCGGDRTRKAVSRRAGAEALQPWAHARDKSRRAPQRAKGERSHAGRDYEQNPTGSGAAHARENATELATPCAGRIGTLGEGLSEHGDKHGAECARSKFRCPSSPMR